MVPLIDNLKRRELPLVTLLLIFANCVMFFAWQMKSDSPEMQVVKHGTVPYEITHPGKQCAPYSDASGISMRCDDEELVERESHEKFPGTWRTIFTSMFMHGSLTHLLGNMIFLFAFGLSLELGFGRMVFLLFYLVGGVAADLGHTMIDPNSPVPALGASGAISAVMGAYVFVYPKAKIKSWLFPPLPILVWVRAAWLVGFLMLVQVAQAYVVLSTIGSEGGGVAYFAHFGGFAAGIGLVYFLLNSGEIEELRREARIASGDERVVLETAGEVPFNQLSPEAQAIAAAGPGQAAHAVAQAGQMPVVPPQYAAQSYAPAGAMPDPFAPPQAATEPPAPPNVPQFVVPPDPFVPPAEQVRPPQAQNPAA